MSFFSFSSPVDVDVRLEDEDARKQVEIKMDKAGKEKCPIYFDGESVKGSVRCFTPLVSESRQPRSRTTNNQHLHL